MAPLDTGRFIITNSKFKNVVYLPDANSSSDLRGDWHEHRPGQKWNIVLLRNGNYTIKNHDYNSYATCEFVKPDVGHNIVGEDREQQWKIIEEPEHVNSYVICPSRNGHVCWYLADDEDTPITLEKYSQSNKIRWEFSQVEAAEGSGAVGGGKTGRVCGNDDAPSTPVLVPTLDLPTPVQVPTPDVPAPASASSLTSESLIVPGNYYTIGVAGTDQYLANTISHYVIACTTPVPDHWLITKYEDNWKFEDSGRSKYSGSTRSIYMKIKSTNTTAVVAYRPTELSLTPQAEYGPNAFRVTDMESNESWDGLVFTDMGKQ